MKEPHFEAKVKFDWLIVHFDCSIPDENKNCIKQR